MQIRGGGNIPQDAIFEAHPELIGDALSVHLSQEAASAAVWTLYVDVHITQGWFRLGKIVTTPPTGGDPPARVVAFAVCPGAVGWKVTSTCPTDGELAELHITSSKCCGLPFGVTANNPR